MKLKRLLLAVLITIVSTAVYSQENVTNIRAVQKDKMVEIRYDLKVRSEVKVLVSLDDGATYTDTMTMTGYVNKIVQQGKNLLIKWQAFKNLGYGDYPEIRFKFITKEKPLQNTKTKKSRGYSGGRNNRIDKFSFVTLNGAYTNTELTSVGLTYGQVKKYGWFVSVMSGFNFAGLAPADKCDADGFVDGTLPFYKDESAKTALSIMGGGIIRINNNTYARAGLGFGNRSISWKTLDDKWVRNKGYSAVGVDFSLGAMFKFGKFIISLDGVTTNFSIYEGKLGIGYSFDKR